MLRFGSIRRESRLKTHFLVLTHFVRDWSLLLSVPFYRVGCAWITIHGLISY